jgi:hypothetical protein
MMEGGLAAASDLHCLPTFDIGDLCAPHVVSSIASLESRGDTAKSCGKVKCW